MLPTTRSRVPMHTSKADNAAIERRLSDSLDYYAHNLSQIDARLRELDREWDIERAIELSRQTLVSAASCSYSIPFPTCRSRLVPAGSCFA